MSKRLSSSTASTASINSDISDTVEGTVLLTPDAKRAFNDYEKKMILMGLTPTENESYFIKDHQHIYKATTQDGDMEVKYYGTMKRGNDDKLELITDKTAKNDIRKIEKDAVDEYKELYGELVEAKNKDEKSWWSTEKEKIKSLEKKLKENPFGKLQSEMTLYVGGKKRKSRKQKKSLRRKSRKQKKSLKKRR